MFWLLLTWPPLSSHCKHLQISTRPLFLCNFATPALSPVAVERKTPRHKQRIINILYQYFISDSFLTDTLRCSDIIMHPYLRVFVALLESQKLKSRHLDSLLLLIQAFFGFPWYRRWLRVDTNVFFEPFLSCFCWLLCCLTRGVFLTYGGSHCPADMFK